MCSEEAQKGIRETTFTIENQIQRHLDRWRSASSPSRIAAFTGRDLGAVFASFSDCPQEHPLLWNSRNAALSLTAPRPGQATAGNPRRYRALSTELLTPRPSESPLLRHNQFFSGGLVLLRPHATAHPVYSILMVVNPEGDHLIPVRKQK
ncbi:hypothetical protein CALVIDRAFT_33503 [Calocera viscosa TUFC12733]|uniref:Uncharacterized protein n=1 Tax=Calocera viscosa (strain TUFC12733) TaxID=1330018 RepID=A0A167FQT9_CALVF|nr:hypothetical protein CALVIDRAFT_33503 [Calocera viscosa TUFC12733]